MQHHHLLHFQTIPIGAHSFSSCRSLFYSTLLCFIGVCMVLATRQVHAAELDQKELFVSSETEEDLVASTSFATQSSVQDELSILASAPRYLLLCSRSVRPGRVFRVAVNIIRSAQPVQVQAAIYRDSVLLHSDQQLCSPRQLHMLQLEISHNSGPGRYELRVQANEVGELEGTLINRKVDLAYEADVTTALIQLSSPLYRQGQTVQFRVLLLGAGFRTYNTSFNIYLVDPDDISVKHWPYRQSNWGLVSSTYTLSELAKSGTWHVKVVTRAQIQLQPFTVVHYRPAQFEVSVRTPEVQWTSAGHLPATVVATETVGGVTVPGIVTVLAKVTALVPRGLAPTRQQILLKKSQFDGNTTFRINMDKLKAIMSPLDDSEVCVTARVTDRNSGLHVQGHCCTRMLRFAVKLKFLGGPSHMFRPHMPYRFYVISSGVDGSPLSDSFLSSCQMKIKTQVTFRDGKSVTLTDDCCHVLPTPHNNMWDIRVDLSKSNVTSGNLREVMYVSVTAALREVRTQRKIATTQATAEALHTDNNLHIHVVTSTQQPMVGQYAIFHVHSNFHMDELQYVIISRGEILSQELLHPDVPIFTFSVVVTLDMVPEATLLLYHVTSYGHVVSETLRFPVGGLLSNNMSVSVTRSKADEHTPDLLEISVSGIPGQVVGLSAQLRHLYGNKRNYNFSRYLMSQAARWLQPGWSSLPDDSMFHWAQTDIPQSVHLMSHVNGRSLAETLKNCGVLTILDVRYPQMYWSRDSSTTSPPCASGECGLTDDLSCPVTGASGVPLLACRSGGTCYPLTARCDGQKDCADFSDETHCPAVDEIFDIPSDWLRRSHVTTDFISSWLWQQVKVADSGHVILRTEAPSVPLVWDVFVLGTQRGPARLGYVHAHTQVETGDDLRIVLAGVSTCCLGEQVLLRVTVQYGGERDVGANVVLARSDRYIAGNSTSTAVHQESDAGTSPPRNSEHVTHVRLRAHSYTSLSLSVRPLAVGDIQVLVYVQQRGIVKNCTHNIRVTPNGELHERVYWTLVELRDSLRQYVVIGDKTQSSPKLPHASAVTVTLSAGVSAAVSHRHPDSEGVPLTLDAAVVGMWHLLHQLTAQTTSLSAAGTLSAAEIDVALQNILAFRRNDGSFSLLRGGRLSSVRGTTLVVRTLRHMLHTFHPIFYVPDQRLLTLAVRWLVSRQTAEGRFRGSSEECHEDPSQVLLTAYVTIALHELRSTLQLCREKEYHPCSYWEVMDLDQVLHRSFSMLNTVCPSGACNDSTPLQLSAAALALTYDSSTPSSSGVALGALAIHLRRQDGSIYWSDKRSSGARTDPDTLLATAMTTLTHLRLGKLDVLPAIRWLVSHRPTVHAQQMCMAVVELSIDEVLLEYREKLPAVMEAHCSISNGDDDPIRLRLTSGQTQSFQFVSSGDGPEFFCSGKGMLTARVSVHNWLQVPNRNATIPDDHHHLPSAVTSSIPDAGKDNASEVAAIVPSIVLTVLARERVVQSDRVSVQICVRCSPVTSAEDCPLTWLWLQLQLPSGLFVSDDSAAGFLFNGSRTHTSASFSPSSQRFQVVATHIGTELLCGKVSASRWHRVDNTTDTILVSLYHPRQFGSVTRSTVKVQVIPDHHVRRSPCGSCSGDLCGQQCLPSVSCGHQLTASYSWWALAVSLILLNWFTTLHAIPPIRLTAMTRV